MATLTWYYGGNGDWQTVADWGGVAVPGASDLAVINAGTVTLSAAVTLAGLAQTGSLGTVSEISGAQTLTVTGGATLAGTVVARGGGTLLLKGASVIEGAAGDPGPGTLFLDGGETLTNQGQLTLAASGGIAEGAMPGGGAAGGGVVSNASGAQLIIQTTGTAIAAVLGATDLFNYGQVTVQTTGQAIVNSSLQNAGTVTVASGTLALTGGGLSRGDHLKIASGAELAVPGGILTLIGGIFAPSGTVAVTGGIADLSGVLVTAPSSTVSVTGGEMLLGSHGDTVGTMMGSNGGTLSGSGGLSITQGATITGTAWQTGTGLTRLYGSSLLTASGGGGTLALDGGRRVYNYGTMTIADGEIGLGVGPSGGATFVNRAQMVLSGTGTAVSAGTGTVKFVNEGSVSANSSGQAVIAAYLTNHGPLAVNTGTLSLAAGGASLSRFISVAAGATLDIAGGVMTVASGALPLAGWLSVSGGTLNLSRTRSATSGGLSMTGGQLQLASETFSTPTLIASGGTVTGTSILDVSDTAGFSGASVWQYRGTTRLDNNGTLSGAGAAIFLDGGRILENEGDFTLASGSIALGNEPSGAALGDGYLTNVGLFDIQADGTVITGGTGNVNVTNLGTVQKSAGTGTSVIDAVIAGAGTVLALSGTLEFAMAADAGLFGIGSDAALRFDQTMTGGTVAFIGNAGTLDITATTVLNGTISGLSLASANANVIDFQGFAWDSSATVTLTGGILSVSDLAGVRQVLLSDTALPYLFTTASDGTGGLLLSTGGLGPLSLSTGELDLGGDPITAASLTVTGGTLTGTGVLDITGAATFTGVSVELYGGGTELENGGTLSGSGSALYLDGGRILQNSGSLVITSGASIVLGGEPSNPPMGNGYVNNDGTLDIQTDGGVITGVAGDATVTNSGVLEKSAGTGDATILANFVNISTVLALSGTLEFMASALGGVFDIGTAAALQFDDMVSGGTVAFTGSNGTLNIASGASFGGTIAGLGAPGFSLSAGTGNAVDLAGFAWDPTASATFASGTVTVTDTAGTQSLALAGDYSHYTFTTASDGQGGLRLS